MVVLHCEEVRMALEFLTERNMRSLHGHSMSGESPLCRFSPLTWPSRPAAK